MMPSQLARLEKLDMDRVPHWRIAYLAHPSQSLPAPTGALARDHSHIAGNTFTVGESLVQRFSTPL